MKKIVIAALLVFTFSCSPYKEVFMVPYNNLGLFITEANSVSFAYEPIGSIEAVFLNYKQFNSIKLNPGGRWYTHGEALTEAMKMAVNSARERGANGIINFKYRAVYRGQNINGWMVTGMAIKKID